MANPFSPFGFRSFGHRDGSAPTMGLSKYTINSSYASNIFTGDVVEMSSASPGTIELSTVGPFITSSGVKPVGVFRGCEYYNSNVGRVVWSSYFPASAGSSSPVTAYVIDDPEMQFIAQASTGTVVGTSLIGYGISFTLGSGNTTTGISGSYLNSSQVNATSTGYFAWRVVDSYSNFAPPGANGASTDVAGNWLVVQPQGWARNTLTIASLST